MRGVALQASTGFAVGRLHATLAHIVSRRLPAELLELPRLVDLGGPHVHVRRLCEVACDGMRLPVDAVMLGPADTNRPAIGFFGGVHGLERIGAQVVLAHLRSVVARLSWDVMLHSLLERVRLVFMPVVNPGGLLLGTRANPRGVDLMRNAPVQARERVPFLIGGQRISASLPWYRGASGAPLEDESAALVRIVEDELLTRPFSIAIDCHSGFGVRDRLWFPYAHTTVPIPHLPEVHALVALFERAHPNHRYLFEPQSREYLTHGDLWDHLYARALEGVPRVFLPLTLEMGSWAWVRKNPRQVFSRYGIFNPIKPHRQARALRRHHPWLDFATLAVASHAGWCPDGASRDEHRARAMRRWYEGADR